MSVKLIVSILCRIGMEMSPLLAQKSKAPLPCLENSLHYHIVLNKIRAVMSQDVRMIPWKVLGPRDDNSESINTLKVYCP